MGKLEKILEQNTVNIRSLMRNTSDLNVKYGKAGGVDVCALFCEGQIDTNQLANLIYRPLNSIGNKEILPPERVAEIISGELFSAGEQKQLSTYDEVILKLYSGFCVLLIDGITYGIAIGIQGYKTRSVSPPLNHRNIRGSREGFVEAVRTNMSMVRRRIKSPDLVMSLTTMGKLSNTDICICYIEGRADKRLIEEVKGRIERLPLSVILESGYLQPFLEDKNSLFSETGVTERPDVLASKLYDGKIGIIVDGTPFALIVPKLFSENFIAVDDYSEKPIYAFMMRLLRYFAFFIGVYLPGFYVALANFHPELIPDSLLLNLASSVAVTPYNLLVECIIISIFYEIMREAGLRMPTDVGHAVSIVGGIVIGDILVSAGLVGAPILLVIAVSSIAGYIVTDLYNTIILTRFAFILAGGFFGLFGITIATVILLLKLCSMNSYGVPVTAPISPFSLKGMRDTFIRFGWKRLAKTDMKIQDMNGVEINE